MLIVHATIDVDPDHHDAVLAAAATQQDLCRAEDGCHRYDISADVADRGRFYVTELWEGDDATWGAHVTDEEKGILEQVAKCLTTGPLKGRAVDLLGRADPRGETEYNMSLGEARADSVKRYLSDMGVQAQRVAASSRGELDAIGTDEASWATDRRVDVDLAD